MCLIYLYLVHKIVGNQASRTGFSFVLPCKAHPSREKSKKRVVPTHFIIFCWHSVAQKSKVVLNWTMLWSDNLITCLGLSRFWMSLNICCLLNFKVYFFYKSLERDFINERYLTILHVHAKLYFLWQSYHDYFVKEFHALVHVSSFSFRFFRSWDVISTGSDTQSGLPYFPTYFPTPTPTPPSPSA